MPGFEECVCCHGKDRLPQYLMPAMLPSECTGCKAVVCGFCVAHSDQEERLCFTCTTAKKNPDLPEQTITGGCCLRRYQNTKRENKRTLSKERKRDNSPVRDNSLEKIRELARAARKNAKEALEDKQNDYAIDEAYGYTREALDEILELTRSKSSDQTIIIKDKDGISALLYKTSLSLEDQASLQKALDDPSATWELVQYQS